MNEHEPGIMSESNRPLEVRRSGWKTLGLISTIYGAGLATVILAGIACNARGGLESPTPTIDPAVFEPHNVPFVNVTLVDENGDDVFTLFDARRQKGIDWPPGLDRDGQIGDDGKFRITQHDIDVMREFLCLLPASPQNDINGDGHTTEADIDIVNGYLNKEVKDEKNPNARLDEIWREIVIDGNESDPATRNYNLDFELPRPDPSCQENSSEPK